MAGRPEGWGGGKGDFCGRVGGWGVEGIRGKVGWLWRWNVLSFFVDLIRDGEGAVIGLTKGGTGGWRLDRTVLATGRCAGPSVGKNGTARVAGVGILGSTRLVLGSVGSVYDAVIGFILRCSDRGSRLCSLTEDGVISVVGAPVRGHVPYHRFDSYWR